MKYRKSAITILSKGRKIDVVNAKKLETTIWRYGKSVHPRLIRLLLQHKELTVADAYKILAKDITIDKIIENEEDQYVVEGEVNCRKCGSKKVTKQELQTRGMDEATTTFYRCVKCKLRWKN
jgi:DNA-directed RNA polymerase subunit M/transcription elongation factor TFIIS